MKITELRSNKAIFAYTITTFICFFIVISIGYFWQSRDIEPMGVSYYCQYNIDINTTQPGNFTLIIPVIIYPKFPTNHMENTGSKDILNGSLYHRMDELYLSNGNDDTQYEIIR